MLSLGALSFTAPLVLLALLILPVLYWLLRITPPAPRKVIFPPLAFLLDLKNKQTTAQHTPLWLLLLRLILATLVILALAGPMLFAPQTSSSSGPLVLVVDNGWASAHNWRQRQNILYGLIDGAVQGARSIVLVTTAVERRGKSDLSLISPEEARKEVGNLEPHPWQVNRQEAQAHLQQQAPSLFAQQPEFVWLTNALDQDTATPFAEALLQLGPLQIISATNPKGLLILTAPETKSDRFELMVHRPLGGPALTTLVKAIGKKNQVLSVAALDFATDETAAKTAIELPLELRNKTTRIEIDGQRSAAAVALLDERWRRRAVGIVTAQADIDKPLLSDIYYSERALSPYAELRKGTLHHLLQDQLSVLLLPDTGQIPQDDHAELTNWVSQGGTLVRFAGPRLINRSDDLVPVTLRQGGRALGGALSWDEPQSLGPFPDTSPFFGLTIPDDVTVSRQVLAEPSMDLAAKTWAHLEDGTPLVTANRLGDGWLILFHITANAEWSSLPLSGLYVDMLRRVIALSNVAPGTRSADTNPTLLPPLQTLNGFGQLQGPPIDLRTIDPSRGLWLPNPHQPPGLYGNAKTLTAFNLQAETVSLAPVKSWPPAARITDQDVKRSTDLAPWILALAFALALIDGLVILYFGGKLANLRGPGIGQTTLALLVMLGTAILINSPLPAHANGNPEARALEAALTTRLAYVATGNTKTDAMSRAGLAGLTKSIKRRTAAEPGAPLAVNLETDELAFFPLIYWPVDEAQAPLSDKAIAKLNLYMKTGGTIVFDTADQQQRISSFDGKATTTTPAGIRLRRILERLDTPSLVPVPSDHVLTKSFYLLQDFPGRWMGGPVWVEGSSQGGSRGQGHRAHNDGVSSIIVGSNDWAAAWAIDATGRPLAPLVPGGPRQRELATRFGINLVMYTLTGNYKADQVHVPALLERLGQ